MTNKSPTDDALNQGRQLAGRLLDFRLEDLQKLGSEERQKLMAEFPLLTQTQFDDVFRQSTDAQRLQRERVGWQAVPHDIAVLVIVLVTALVDLRAGAVAGVATLVLLESLFQFYFDRRLYRALSTLVWFTYPAYVVMTYVLRRRGYSIPLTAAAVLLTWIGTFLLGMLARLPVRLILESSARSRAELARRQQGESGKPLPIPKPLKDKKKPGE
jgi:hypothetical protein